MKRVIIAIVVLLLASASLVAQTAAYRVRIYAVSGTTALTTTDYPASAVACDLAPPTTGSNTNPNVLIWDDATKPGRVCKIAALSTTGLPAGFGSYELTLTQVSGTMETEESARSPFSRTPGAPTNVRPLKQ